MNMLVIGNGFDLANRLPTRYKDFLEFVKLLQKNLREEKISDDFVVDCFENLLKEKKLWTDKIETA